ncbi:P68 family surface lipoprotein [Candidatus Mycoplasma pogonae]
MKITKGILALSSIMVPTALIACSSATTTNPINQNLKIIFQTSQASTFPLMQPLAEAVKQYNKTQKGTPNFLEVELQDSAITKANSEYNLAKQVITKLETIKNNQDDKGSEHIPNIILNNARGAFMISQYNRLLDINSLANVIDETILPLHQQLPGQKQGNIYSLPFDLMSNDNLVFNLDIMKLIFDQIKAGGGSIDETSQIAQRVLKAAREGNAEIPNNKIWKHMQAKSSAVFQGFNVNDATFANLDQILNFTNRIYEGLQLNPNLTTEQKNALKNSFDPKILMIEYEQELFKKYLYSKLGADVGNELFGSPEKFLWYLKTDDKGIQTIFYAFEEGTSDDEKTHQAKLKQKLQEAFDSFVKASKYRELKAIKVANLENPKLFYGAYNATLKNTDWSSNNLLEYGAAMAIVPAVHVANSYENSKTRASEGQNKPEKYQTFAKRQDIWWKPQLLNFSDNQINPIFQEGGSNLVVLKTNNATRDQATKKFLTWLYNGTMQDANNNSVLVRDYLRDKTSYIFPAKNSLTTTQYNKLLAAWEQLNQKIIALQADASANDEELAKLLTEVGRLEGALLNLGDYIQLKGINPKDGSKIATSPKLTNIAIDTYTDNIIYRMKSLIRDWTRYKKPQRNGADLVNGLNTVPKK